MTKEEISAMARFALSNRIRSAMKYVLEEAFEEEMIEHIRARRSEKKDDMTGMQRQLPAQPYHSCWQSRITACIP